MKTFRYISFLIILTSLLFQGCQKPSMIPSDLRTEYLIDPVNIDMITPCLSWKLEPASPELRNLSQKSYQVLVSSSHNLLDKNTGDLWNSGIVESSNSTQIVYSGSELRSRETYYPWENPENVTDNNHPISKSQGVKVMGQEKERTVVQVGSGEYHYRVQVK